MAKPITDRNVRQRETQLATKHAREYAEEFLWVADEIPLRPEGSQELEYLDVLIDGGFTNYDDLTDYVWEGGQGPFEEIDSKFIYLDALRDRLRELLESRFSGGGD